MTALQSMIKKLAPLRLYNLESGSNVYNELCSYAAALDAHREALDTTLREMFVSTAESYGIENREKVFGDVREGYALNIRRKMLIDRACIGENDYTPESLGKYLESLGITDFGITEDPNGYSVTVVIGGSYPQAEAEWMLNQIMLFLPAHLAPNVYFGGYTWSEIDELTGTFAEIDSMDHTWSQLNNL